jgi:hypothetical protein
MFSLYWSRRLYDVISLGKRTDDHLGRRGKTGESL